MLKIPSEAYQLNPIHFAKVVCEKNWRWTSQEHTSLSNYDLWYVWDGEGEIIMNGELKIPLSKGCCLLFRPGDRALGSHNPDKPLVVTYIHFSILEVRTTIEQPSRYRHIVESYEMEWLLSRYVYLMLSSSFEAETEAKLVLKQLIVLLFREDYYLEQPQQNNHYSINRALQETAIYIRQNAASWFRMNDLAKRAHMSPRHFSEIFKVNFGQTVQTYIIRMRLERAEYLLRYNGMNVTEVAEALGYENIQYFSRQFKQYRGINPSEIKGAVR